LALLPTNEASMKPDVTNEFNTALSPRLYEAFSYAAHLHRNQKRKGTTIPYVAHLMSVAALVLEEGGDEDEAIAGLLHDAVEDQGGRPTLEAIRDRFGERVASIVESCSDAETIPKPPWQERKDQYLAHLRTADDSVVRVSLADKLHNARAILVDYHIHGEELWSRFNATRDQTLWYYRALLEVFRERSTSWAVDELSRAVDDLERAVSDRRIVTPGGSQ
jgi:(p)ppGpp synthase/HD superfamily hydrolase